MTRKITAVIPNTNVKTTRCIDDKQPKIMKKYDIFYVYRVNNYYNKIFGLQKITYDGENIETVGIVAKLYALALLVLIFFSEYMLIADLQTRGDVRDIVKIIDILSNVCVTITISVCVLTSAFLVSPFMVRALRSVSPVDEKLGIQTKQQYVHLRRRIILAQVTLLAVSVCHFIYEILVGVEQWSTSYRALTTHLVDFSVYVQLLDFTTVVWIIVTRFKVFNTQLIELTNNESDLDIDAVAFPREMDSVKTPDIFVRTKSQKQIKCNPKNKPENLIRLMKTFDEMADVTNIISSCYGLSILLYATLAFLYIISTVNGLIMFDDLHREDDRHTYTYIIGWCLPNVVYLVMSAYACESMKNEIEKTKSYVDNLSINTEHGSENSELIENFVKLLSVRDVIITAGNFFPFDMTFVLSLVGAVATYTVLLMQVKPAKQNISSINGTVAGNFTNVTAD